MIKAKMPKYTAKVVMTVAMNQLTTAKGEGKWNNLYGSFLTNFSVNHKNSAELPALSKMIVASIITGLCGMLTVSVSMAAKMRILRAACQQITRIIIGYLSCRSVHAFDITAVAETGVVVVAKLSCIISLYAVC